MSLSVSESVTGSGLLVAEQAADERAVSRMLRAHDPNLRLVPQVDEAGSGVLWQVWYYHGPDQGASHWCSWQTPHGEPLPLSSRILEMVQQHDRRTAGRPATPDELNEAHRESVRRDKARSFEALADDHKPYIDRGRVSVSVSDAKNGKPGWQRSRRPGT